MRLETTLLRACLVACALSVAVSACGRRGPLERPVAAAAPAELAAAEPAAADGAELEEAQDGLVPSVSPRPQRTVRGGPLVPTTPFVLDPLL